LAVIEPKKGDSGNVAREKASTVKKNGLRRGPCRLPLWQAQFSREQVE
jgi:hypothetical protein